MFIAQNTKESINELDKALDDFKFCINEEDEKEMLKEMDGMFGL